MENKNVKVEMPQQSHNSAELECQTPNFFKRWNQIVAEELLQASEIAKTTFKQHTDELNTFICEYLHKGCRLAIMVCSMDLTLYHIRVNPSDKKPKLSQIWVCNHPTLVLRPLSPEAQKEYFRVYINLMKEEYGAIEMNEVFELKPYDYLHEVIPHLVVPTESQTPQPGAEQTENAEPPKTAVIIDDIELMFSRRNQNQ